MTLINPVQVYVNSIERVKHFEQNSETFDVNRIKHKEDMKFGFFAISTKRFFKRACTKQSRRDPTV